MLAACGRLGFGDTTDAGNSDGSASVDAPTGICATRTFANAPASSFSDDFSTGTLADRWLPTAACVNQVGGELVATVPSSTSQYCHAWTLASYHLTCDA